MADARGSRAEIGERVGGATIPQASCAHLPQNNARLRRIEACVDKADEPILLAKVHRDKAHVRGVDARRGERITLLRLSRGHIELEAARGSALQAVAARVEARAENDELRRPRSVALDVRIKVACPANTRAEAAFRS